MRDWDAAESLINDETIAAYLERAMLKDDNEFYTDCLADAVRAKMINELAIKTGIPRRDIFELLSPEAETPPTIVKNITIALGLSPSRKEVVLVEA